MDVSEKFLFELGNKFAAQILTAITETMEDAGRIFPNMDAEMQDQVAIHIAKWVLMSLIAARVDLPEDRDQTLYDDLWQAVEDLIQKYHQDRIERN